MNDLDFLRQAHAALRDAANATPDGEARRHLRALQDEAWTRLRFAERCVPLVFARHPGYVWIGTAGREQPYAHPGHPGIDEAWRVLLHGATAGSVLHASTFGGSGNALNGRLRTAIEWIEHATGCYDLAGYLRGIKVGRDGSIAPPPTPRPINLHL